MKEHLNLGPYLDCSFCVFSSYQRKEVMKHIREMHKPEVGAEVVDSSEEKKDEIEMQLRDCFYVAK